MIGRTLGHYRILEQIGAGGMGVVYRARDERLERDVALKVLPSGTLANDSVRKRFRREALAVSQLNHPNIATVYDFDTEEGVDFLVLDSYFLLGIGFSPPKDVWPNARAAALKATQMDDSLAEGMCHWGSSWPITTGPGRTLNAS